MNQTTLDLYSEYKNELTELIDIAESSPAQFQDKGVVNTFNREFDKLVALTNLYGRILHRQNFRGPDSSRRDFRRN